MTTGISPRRKGEAIKRHGKRCYYCGLPLLDLGDPADLPKFDRVPNRGDYKLAPHAGYGILTIDHLNPRAKGGSNEPDNLVPCCWHCNAVKRDKELFYLDCGG